MSEQVREMENIARWLDEQAEVLRSTARMLEGRSDVEAAKQWVDQGAELVAAVKGLREDAERIRAAWFDGLAKTRKRFRRYRRPGEREILRARPRCPRCGRLSRGTRTAGRPAGQRAGIERLASRCSQGHIWEYEGLAP